MITGRLIKMDKVIRNGEKLKYVRIIVEGIFFRGDFFVNYREIFIIREIL